MRTGATRLRLHGGGAPFAPDSYYLVRDGQLFNGLIAWLGGRLVARVADVWLRKYAASGEPRPPDPRLCQRREGRGPRP
jgi:hypothetical protein